MKKVLNSSRRPRISKDDEKLSACHAGGRPRTGESRRPRFDIVKPRRKTGHFVLDIIKSDDIFYDK